VQEQWRIGELADATGVTVRTLRHYHRLGLLVPSSRTSGGHRCYTGTDVRRLHMILALRRYGLSLHDIGETLAATADPREILRRQLAETEERIRQARLTRIRLLGLLGALEEPSAEEFISLIEGMVLMDKPLTTEQLERMNRERQERTAQLSPEELAEMSRRRARAMAELTPEQIAQMQRERARWMPGVTD
jgi:DNA-binding transcriptional MerR regulator